MFAMTTLDTIARRFAGIALAVALSASQAAVAPAWSAEDGSYQTSAADCYAIGAQVAAQYGGTLAKVSTANQGGQTVCVIVVLIPGKDGSRPRREQVVVPAG